MRQRWIENLPNKEWWKLDANLTGGELFHLIHELDLLCWLLGDIEAVLLKRLIKHITIRQTAVMCCSCYYVLKWRIRFARNGHCLSITPMGHSNSW